MEKYVYALHRNFVLVLVLVLLVSMRAYMCVCVCVHVFNVFARQYETKKGSMVSSLLVSVKKGLSLYRNSKRARHCVGV